MENKINIAELLKYCPSGMELNCPLFENLEFDRIDKDNGVYSIICRVKTEWECYNTHTFTEYGCYSTEKYSKCVIFPKGKTTWEGFQRPFKDGDIIVTKIFNNFIFYSIYKGVENREVLTYIDYTPDDNGLINVNHTLCHSCEIIEQRLATEEEKQKLFDAIKANGYKWNPETKTLEKLVEPKFKVGDRIKYRGEGIVHRIIQITEDLYVLDNLCSIPISIEYMYNLVPNKFDITTLKVFNKVLVRDSNKGMWSASIFSHTWENKYICIGIWYNQCIPYEGNEHLLGTANDCDEYYKTWE